MLPILAAITLLFGLAAPSAARASTFRLTEGRTVELIDTVDGTMFEQVLQIERLSRDGGAIDILVNSPGGSVVVGYTLVDAMEQARRRGSHIRCVVPVLAASMAFNLLVACDERYALPHALLLFHPLRVSSRQGFTTEELRALNESLAPFERRAKASLSEMMGVRNSAWFERHYRSETLWDAETLHAATGNWFTLVDRVEGSPRIFETERPRQGLFDGPAEKAQPSKAGKPKLPGRVVIH